MVVICVTHARVDERAGLAKGSTSNYFRTRQSLLVGVMDGRPSGKRRR